MSSLFRSLHNFSLKQENAVKDALINTLSENARDILYEKQAELELSEVKSALCTTLEAIFLHGLKNSLIWRTINVIAGDEERRPEPTFWSPLMIFLHKQVIEQIQSLSQIVSETGFCRAWIRQSLNECLCSAYFLNIRKNSSALSPYYKKYALLKDGGALEAAAKIMESIETQVQFDLAVNSSLLNHWPDYSLQLSGLWAPALKSCPISSGIDIACSLPNETQSIPTPQPVQTNELFSESISNSPFSRPSNFAVEDFNQRENLELFLQKVDEMDIINEEDTEIVTETKDTESIEHREEKPKKERKRSREHERKIKDMLEEPPSPSIQSQTMHGNSLMNLMQTSWSSDLNQTEDGHYGRYLQRSVSMTSSTGSLRSPLGDRCSYNALLKKHERNRDLDWTEVWEKFLIQNTGSLNTGDQNDETECKADTVERSSNGSRANSEFEVVSNSALEKFDIVELQEMVEQLCKLPREPGLDVQGFLCKSCQHPLGIGYSNFRVCAFSGNYFCDCCMDVQAIIIPARIIYNWDFRRYTVSKRAMAFLAEFRSQPFVDLKLLNPYIYTASEAMAELQSLRIRLNFLRAYLQTCSPASIELLQKPLFGKEYIYEHIHHYSIGDLGLIQRGTLCQQLQKAYKIGEGHVLKCPLCSMKGFICEICKSPRVLYPFHIETTYRCETCGAVFHAHCLNAHQPCPKCERNRKREDVPDLERTQSIEKPTDSLKEEKENV